MLKVLKKNYKQLIIHINKNVQEAKVYRKLKYKIIID